MYDELETLRKEVEELKKCFNHHEHIDEISGRKQEEWWTTRHGEIASRTQTHKPYKVTGFKRIEHIIMARCPEEAASLFKIKSEGAQPSEIGREKISFTCVDCGKIVYYGEMYAEYTIDKDSYSACLDCYSKSSKKRKRRGQLHVNINNRIYEGEEATKYANIEERNDEYLSP